MTTSLGLLIVAVMVKVTCLAVPAAVICRLASRKGPAAGSWTAGASLLLILAVTFASFFPAPARRVQRTSASESMERAATTSAMRTVSAEGSETARPVSSPRGFSLSLLLDRWRDFPTRLNLNIPTSSRWPMVVAWLTIPGIALGMARLALGLWTIADCRRKSTRLNDPRASALLTAIAEVAGCSRAIELREFHTSRSPATAGWLRPVVYLPPTWTAWSDGDLRAVLSHEVAHIQRSDYVIGLMARLAEAIHFYHPAVRWLTARLLTQQELAADALGASLSGGKAPYLAALSRIALGNDVPSSWWLARTFAPAKGTLIRRIEMLKAHDESRPNSWPHPRRLATGAALAAIALTVCLSPNPISRAEGPGEPPRPATTANTFTQPRPFDLRYIPPRSMGIYAVRPAALFAEPQLQSLTNRIGEDIISTLQLVLKQTDQIDSSLPFAIQDIEEVSAPIMFRLFKSVDEKTMRAMSIPGFTARTTKPFDWQTLIRKWWPELTEIRIGDQRYYKLKPNKKAEPLLGKEPCFLFPDDRTIAYYEEPDMRAILNNNPRNLPKLATLPEWETAAHAMACVALDNRDQRILEATRRTTEIDRDDLFHNIMSNSNFIFTSLSAADSRAFQCTAQCNSEEQARKLSDRFQVARQEYLKVIEGSKKPTANDLDSEMAGLGGAMQSLLTNLKISSQGNVTRLESGETKEVRKLLPLFVAFFW